MGRVKTGDPTPYSPADEAAVEAAVVDAFREFGGDDMPTEMEVTADIEWAGSRNPAALRTTTLTGLDRDKMRAVRAAATVAAARAAMLGEAREKAEKALPATGWHAQLRELTRTDKGMGAADRAGLEPAKQTLLRWLREEQAPSRANRDRIATAYASLKSGRVAAALGQSSAANARVSDALTTAVRERYGAEVRFFGIRGLRFGR